MVSQTLWLNMARLRPRVGFIAYGHAMLLSLVKLCIILTGNLSEFVFAGAEGRIVPISRGSPPIT
jgi:hypothetical protein